MNEEGNMNDEAQDAALLAPLIKAMEMIIDKFEALEERVECLDKLVTEEIIGGITKLYNEKSRMSGISSMSEKYKDKFDPYKDFYGEMTDGQDLYEKLFDEISEMKGESPDWNDETEGSKVSELAEMLKGKFEAIKRMGPPSVSVEIEKTSAEPEGDPRLEKLREMKRKAPNVKY